MKFQSRMFSSCVLPVLTYGAQTWAFTKANFEKLTTQRSIERRMVGTTLRERKKNALIRTQTKVTHLTENTQRNWNVIGINIVTRDTRITVGTTVVRNQTQERPQKRCTDDRKWHAGLAWRRTARGGENQRKPICRTPNLDEEKLEKNKKKNNSPFAFSQY